MRRGIVPVILVAGLMATACGTAATATPQPTDTPRPATLQAAEVPRTAAVPTPNRTAVKVIPQSMDTPGPAVPQAADKLAPISEEQSREELKGARFSTSEWRGTNFRIRSVPLREFRGGGPGKDDIPPIDAPKFETVEQADKWLDGREAVQVVEIKGDARAYPQQILVWHEVVNDTVGGEPVTVTY